MYNFIKNPHNIIKSLGARGLLNWLPDKVYLNMIYKSTFGKKLNFENPVTYNEKLQWLKLYDRKPEYSKYVDKYTVRSYIAEVIGEQYLIPLLGVYNDAKEIEWGALPNSFVLKCTHGAGANNIICKNKEMLDINFSIKRINKWMKRNWYWYGREWPYKNVKPRIICEKYMVDESGYELKDYKFFCFNGEPKVMFVATDRGIDTRFDFFDMKFNHLPITQHYKNASKEIRKPIGFKEMVELSKMLSKDFVHIRVDFYNIYGRVYFGELTFYHFSGFVKFIPEEYDEIFGSWIALPSSDNQRMMKSR